MKSLRFLTPLSGVAVWLALGAACLHAQNAAPKAGGGAATPPPAAKPPGDPFVKAKPAPAKPAPVAPDSVHNMVFTFEIYKMPQDALSALQEEGLAPQAFFDRVVQMAAAGKAQLEHLMALPTRSGQRAASSSVDELLYPTEFDPAEPGRPFHFPTAYEMRPLGEQLEVDPVEGPTGDLADLGLSLQLTRLAGFVAAKADPVAVGEALPIIVSRQVNTHASCKLDVPTFLGTLSAPKGTGDNGLDGDGSVSLLFARYRHSSPAVAGSGKAVAQPDGPLKNLHITFRFYSLPRGKARELLTETVDADKLVQLTEALPKEEAKLERLITLIGRSGQRSLTSENGEWMYGTEMNLPKPIETEAKPVVQPNDPNQEDPEANAGGANPAAPVKKGLPLIPAGFSRFETREVGWRVEVEPVVSPDGLMAELNLAPELTEYRGILQGGPLVDRYPEQPLFGLQKVTTAVTTVLGRQCFLGTLSRPPETGVNERKDDGRTWFAFVKVTLQ